MQRVCLFVFCWPMRFLLSQDLFIAIEHNPSIHHMGDRFKECTQSQQM